MQLNGNDVVLEINNLLYLEWDPIGVKKLAPTDEYMEYAKEIVSQMRERDEYYIFIYLTSVRQKNMRLPSNDDKDKQIAKKVSEILRSHDELRG